MLNSASIIRAVVSLAIVVVSVVLHEVAHAWAAYRLGDDTAKRAGRISLNPARHLDPFGSVVLPLLMSLVGGPVFAFAIPVPYNPNNLRKPKRDEVFVALAGPACNFIQAVVGSLAFRALDAAWTGNLLGYQLLSVVASYVYINLTLMFFNLIPLPPLDGSSIISPLLDGEARRTYYRVQRYSMPILLVALYVLPSVLGFDPVGQLLYCTAGSAYSFLMGA